MKINEELQTHIWPLRAEEKKGLEQSLLKEGCRDALIFANIDGQDILIDGHNRKELCDKNGIEYKTELNEDIKTLQEAKDWMDANQLSRRNLTEDQWQISIGRQYNSEKKEHGGDRSKRQNLPLEKTSEKLSEEYKVSARTVKNYAKKATEYEKLKEERPDVAKDIETGKTSFKLIKKQDQIKKAKQNKEGQIKSELTVKPKLFIESCYDFSIRVKEKSIDLLLTDPPFSTDVADIDKFAKDWLPYYLNKIKPTGAGFVFIGAYPSELKAYLNIETPEHIKLEQVLVWTYRNTLGQTPKEKYKLNWQAVLFFKGIDFGVLNESLTAEKWAVQDIPAPDGRQGDRYHEWQKPIEICERFIRHTTKEGDSVIDPFACTGTTLLAASKLGRKAAGCDIKKEHAKIAEDRGCNTIIGSTT